MAKQAIKEETQDETQDATAIRDLVDCIRDLGVGVRQLAEFCCQVYPGDLSDTVRRTVHLKLQVIDKRLAEKS
jgi:hypothetical protein